MDNTDTIKNKINQKIGDKKFFYISNEIEHGFGLEEYINNFCSICLNDHFYLDILTNEGREFFCLKRENPDAIIKTSAQLLAYYFDKGIIKPGDFVQTFKISSQFEKFASDHNLHLINTSALLNQKFEQKISQAKIFDEFKINTPYKLTRSLKDLTFQHLESSLSLPFVIQFNRGHTGLSTIFIETKHQYEELQNNFPNRTARFAPHIGGQTYSANCAQTKYGVYIGGIYKQITGIAELTANKGATVGGTWDNQLDSKQLTVINEQLNRIRSSLDKYGYRGLFGFDFIINQKDDSVHIIEINARQQMTVAFNSKLNRIINQMPLSLIHIAEFFDIDFDIPVEEYNTRNILELKAGQLYKRVKSQESSIQSEESRSKSHPASQMLRRTGNENIKNRSKTGEYDLDGNFICDECRIDRINPKNLIILIRKEVNTLKHGDEVARIQTLNKLIQDSKLENRYIRLLK